MRCIVTAGPTFEPLDEVRRLTNFSTGRLGAMLANFLVARGHEVILLLARDASTHEEFLAQRVERFTTTSDLRDRLNALSSPAVNAVFHAAAVSDFRVGKVFHRSSTGDLVPAHSGKFSTREGSLLVELEPTPKIIAELRGFFPNAFLAGWKYEIEGDRASVVAKAEAQLRENRTDTCVANGPAYGAGFGLVRLKADPIHFVDPAGLFAALAEQAESGRGASAVDPGKRSA
jgi:phosphopantothenate---cysteine ligase (CTP)